MLTFQPTIYSAEISGAFLPYQAGLVKLEKWNIASGRGNVVGVLHLFWKNYHLFQML